jgi:DNA polymerase III subunit epsilon
MEQPKLQTAEDIFLQLDRPIVFFDLETTGTDPYYDRIIEICAIKLLPYGTRESLYHLLNPGIPIPEEASEINGFTDEQVADKPSFAEVAKEIAAFFTGCDLGGYNVRRFDAPFIMEEFHRCKLYPILLTETKIIDAQTVFHKKEPRDLSSAVKFFVKEDHTNAHSAQVDVEATIKVLKHQLITYGDLKPDVDFLHSFSADDEDFIDFSGKFRRNKKGQLVYKFGKYKNKVVNLSDPNHVDYFKWFENKPDTTVEMKMAMRRIKAQHQCVIRCKQWLDKLEITLDVVKTLALYKTVVSGEGFEPFTIEAKGQALTVIYSLHPDQLLQLADKDSKHVFLQLLKNYFNEMGGLEHIQATIATK